MRSVFQLIFENPIYAAVTLVLWGAISGDAADTDRLVRETEPLSPQQEQNALHAPDGFEIQLFASEPMINKPINLAFDDRGRLWVSSTVEYPYAAKQVRWSDKFGSRVADSRDAIKILEDTDGDGRADSAIDFADGLNIPTGVLPWHKPEHKSGCIAWSIPNIWYFADTTGDEKCDLREVLFGPMGFEKDTHGMCSNFRMGHGGWVYATHGFNNTSRAKGADGHEIELHSGNVFRFKPDGSRIEVFTRGQVNPFGLAFDRRGNLYSADCHSAPIYQLLHGATYPHFSKPEPPLGFGPTMIEHTHGSTGICGIVYLDQNVWGADFNDHILIGNPVNSKVNHDSIRFVGTTPIATEKSDFITSDDPWFRPVDLQIGPDGALYVADFYNRIIGHYEVPLDHPGRDRERGRIWRVVKKSGVNAPVSPIKIETVSDPISDLKSDDLFRVRTAATAMQHEPIVEAIRPLQVALKATPASDTHLRYVLKLALRQHLLLPDGLKIVERRDPEIEKIALDIPTAEAAHYLAHLGPTSDSNRITHIARYGSDEIRRLLIRVQQMPTMPATAYTDSLRNIVRGFEEAGVDPYHPELVNWATNLAPTLLKNRNSQGVADWNQIKNAGSESPWILQQRICGDGQEVDVLSSLRIGDLKPEQRTGTIRSNEFVAPDTLSFWICGHRGNPANPAHEKNFVRLIDAETNTEIQRAFPPRNDVCQLVKWDLSAHVGAQARLEIVDGDDGGSFAWLGITRIDPAVISVKSFNKSANYDKALSFLADYLKVVAPADLREQLKPFLPAGPAPPPREIFESDRKILDELITGRIANFDSKNADSEKGKVVFKTHCAACHQIEGEGGLIGPQLTGIGSRGADRLAEDILDPNRNVDANFRITTLTLKDGTTNAGFLTGERGEMIQLIDPARKIHRFQKSDVEKREQSSMSLMPTVFGQTIPEKDFHDLLGFLLGAGQE